MEDPAAIIASLKRKREEQAEQAKRLDEEHTFLTRSQKYIARKFKLAEELLPAAPAMDSSRILCHSIPVASTTSKPAVTSPSSNTGMYRGVDGKVHTATAPSTKPSTVNAVPSGTAAHAAPSRSPGKGKRSVSATGAPSRTRAGKPEHVHASAPVNAVVGPRSIAVVRNASAAIRAKVEASRFGIVEEQLDLHADVASVAHSKPHAAAVRFQLVDVNDTRTLPWYDIALTMVEGAAKEYVTAKGAEIKLGLISTGNEKSPVENTFQARGCPLVLHHAELGAKRRPKDAEQRIAQVPPAAAQG
jgi:hypothetical protein